MGTSLNGLTPAATYQGLIKFGDNSIIGATAKYLSDGAGNDLPISVSTTTVGINTTSTFARLNIANTNTLNNQYLLQASTSAANFYVRNDGYLYNAEQARLSNILIANIGSTTISSTLSGASGGVQYFGGSGVGFSGNGGLTPTATIHAKGSGSTSATTSLLVQNSAGTQMLQVRDDNRIYLGASGSWTVINGTYLDLYISAIICENLHTYMYGGSSFAINMATRIGSQSAPVATAQLQVDSTTKGFLPPRMTTTEKNAIATPAAGLVVYDTTTNKLCCYNGSTWNDLF